MKVKEFLKKAKDKAKYVVCAVPVAVAASGTVVAKASDTSTSASGIDINFDPSQMFTYSNVIIDCLMPVVYITAGLSLGFTVIYALKSAFGNRM